MSVRNLLVLAGLFVVTWFAVTVCDPTPRQQGLDVVGLWNLFQGSVGSLDVLSLVTTLANPILLLNIANHHLFWTAFMGGEVIYLFVLFKNGHADFMPTLRDPGWVLIVIFALPVLLAAIFIQAYFAAAEMVMSQIQINL